MRANPLSELYSIVALKGIGILMFFVGIVRFLPHQFPVGMVYGWEKRVGTFYGTMHPCHIHAVCIFHCAVEYFTTAYYKCFLGSGFFQLVYCSLQIVI